MALISVVNVEVLNNPTKFSKPFQLQITFECIQPGINGELEWKLTYVGSAEDEKYDQELDSVLVGPVQIGKNQFIFEAPAPDITKIPIKDLLEVTVILLTCSYREQEFIRIGYYVNTDYEAPITTNPSLNLFNPLGQVMQPTQTPSLFGNTGLGAIGGIGGIGSSGIDSMSTVPTITSLKEIDINRINRTILADKPRVTRFQIKWDETEDTEMGSTSIVSNPNAPSTPSLLDTLITGHAPMISVVTGSLGGGNTQVKM